MIDSFWLENEFRLLSIKFSDRTRIVITSSDHPATRPASKWSRKVIAALSSRAQADRDRGVYMQTSNCESWRTST